MTNLTTRYTKPDIPRGGLRAVLISLIYIYPWQVLLYYYQLNIWKDKRADKYPLRRIKREMHINNIVMIEPAAPGDHVYKTVKMPPVGSSASGNDFEGEGYSVKVLMGHGNSISPPRDINAADLVGISTTTSTSTEAYQIARYARSREIPVVIGGEYMQLLCPGGGSLQCRLCCPR